MLCGGRSSGWEAIDPNRGVAVELAPLCLARAGDQVVEDLDPGRIRVRQFGDGPVAAVHHAVEAEAIDDVRDVGPHLLLRPVAVIGLGDHARHLADDVGQPGKLPNLPPPGLPPPMLDARPPNSAAADLPTPTTF